MEDKTSEVVIEDVPLTDPTLAEDDTSESSWAWHWFDGVLIVLCLAIGIFIGWLFFSPAEYTFVKAAPKMSFSFDRLTDLDRNIGIVEWYLGKAKSKRDDWQCQSQQLVGKQEPNPESNWSITFLPNGVQLTK